MKHQVNPLNTPPAEILAAADEIRRSLVDRGLRLAAAESLTGGYVQSLISTAAGVSECFQGGVVAYNLEQKVKLLGVDRSHAAEVDCVSPRVAREMAQGVCRLMQADVAVATTGYASPEPEQGVTMPFAFVSIWRRGGDEGEPLFEGRFEKDDHRIAVQQYIAHETLLALLEATRRL